MGRGEGGEREKRNSRVMGGGREWREEGTKGDGGRTREEYTDENKKRMMQDDDTCDDYCELCGDAMDRKGHHGATCACGAD